MSDLGKVDHVLTRLNQDVFPQTKRPYGETDLKRESTRAYHGTYIEGRIVTEPLG